jgi:hypothetical protein
MPQVIAIIALDLSRRSTRTERCLLWSVVLAFGAAGTGKSFSITGPLASSAAASEQAGLVLLIGKTILATSA